VTRRKITGGADTRFPFGNGLLVGWREKAAPSDVYSAAARSQFTSLHVHLSPFIWHFSMANPHLTLVTCHLRPSSELIRLDNVHPSGFSAHVKNANARLRSFTSRLAPTSGHSCLANQHHQQTTFHFAPTIVHFAPTIVHFAPTIFHFAPTTFHVALLNPHLTEVTHHFRVTNSRCSSS
jgi:hypothetical protein